MAKIWYENETYDINLAIADEDPGSCTYQVDSNRNDLLTIVQDGVNPNIFHITVGALIDNRVLVTLTYTIVDNVSNTNITDEYFILSKRPENDVRYYTKTEIDSMFVWSPNVDEISWSSIKHYDNNTYDLTITATDPKGQNLTYQLTCDDTNVVIVQDGVDDNIFHVTYPNFTEDNIVLFTIKVFNELNIFDSVIFSKYIHNLLINPGITNFSWNDNNHKETGTYDLDITAVDPQGQDLIYQLVCDDTNVTITQDGTNDNIFHVTYPEYASNTTVNYTITVTNEDLLTDVETDAKLVIDLNPVIDSFSWDDNSHEEQETYDLTITAHDPQSQDLTYDVVCDDGNVTITQDGVDDNIFHVTYPEYDENTDVTFTITVTNEDLRTDVETDVKTVAYVQANPVIDSFSWDDNSHEEQETYDLTITAHDENNQDLTYDVVCDDGNVTITQDGVDDNIFHVTYPDYSSNTTVNYTITVTNEDLLTDVETDSRLVAIDTYGDRGILGGGTNGSTRLNVIEYITISTTGNATDFGDLLANKERLGAASNGANDRGVFGGGYDGSASLDVIEYITISTLGNGTNFGDLTVARRGLSATSNGTDERGLFGGGWSSGNFNTIDYITISTPGDATDFGDLIAAKERLAATSNGTNDRGIFCGGNSGSYSNVIEYVTISTPGDGTDFGDLTVARQDISAASNDVNNRGVFGGGHNGSYLNVIDYITISTLGDATDFGDLTVGRRYAAATSNGINDRGIFAGGNDSNYSNVIDYVTITTPGNAVDFGDLTEAKQYVSACSDS